MNWNPNLELIGDILANGNDGTIAVWNKLQYDRDGIIEASAGTGKTFTLQRIVLRLVSDSDEARRVNVRNILLVTFTEKAAGELKDRIRKILDETGCLDSDFAETTICTIHSFCRELLSSFAFGNRVPMQFSIAGSDNDLIHRAVRKALLGDEFKTQHGGTFSNDMEAASLDSSDVLAAESERFLGKCAKAGKAPNEFFVNARERLSEIVDKTSFDFDGLEIHGGDKGYPDALKNVLAKLNDLRSQEYSAFFAAVSAIKAVATSDGKTWAKLNPRVKIQKGHYERLFEIRPDLQIFANVVADVAEGIPAPIIADVAQFAWPEFQRLKDESSALTFDDLVTQASRVVAQEAESEEQGRRSELLDAIRRRYRIALVDEFQDTDMRQWDLFRQIFSSKVNRIEGDGVPQPRQGFLLVVGDPKQAIYGWRGADVATYLAAKEAITSGDGAQPCQTLDKTYRSARDLVSAFNAIFGEESGWFNGMTEGGKSIAYLPVEYPEDNERFKDLQDFTGREAVNLLESLPEQLPDIESNRGSPGYGNKAMSLPVFMENAAREMKRLHALSTAYTTTDKDGNVVPHKIEYRDMCVLVRGHADALAAQRVLARHGIPYAYYKEAGLFATEEVEALLALFDYLTSPGTAGNLAALLLTPLFGVHPADLGKKLSEGGNEFSKLLERWQELSAKRDWSKLFESVMDDTLLARPDADDFEFDRRWTAFRQALDKLLAAKGRSALDVGEFASLLRSWREDDKRAGENASLRQMESEGDRVQIMTMHASKGLEFKSVFVAAGWSKTNEDANAEKRLYYVALTRAEHKLYLPWTQWSPHLRAGQEEQGVGSRGSLLLGDGFLSKGIQSFFEDPAKKVLSLRGGGGNAGDSGTSGASGGGEGADTPKLYKIPYLKNLRLQWDSFTSILGWESSRKAKSANGGPPDESKSKFGGKTLLPRTNVSGTVFHEIMEKLCGNDEGRGEIGFSIGQRERTDALEDKAFAEIVAAAMRKHAVGNQERDGDSTAKTLMRMAWSALNAEIRFTDGASFFLKDVAPADRRAEVEFVVDEKAVFGEELPTMAKRARIGAFNGKIDLLVRPNGLKGVYILDWKTNSLDNFAEKEVATEMAKERYDLQFKMYSLAVRQWLGEDALGGVAYVFVRGGENGSAEKVGVYARVMDDALAADCRASVLKELPRG